MKVLPTMCPCCGTRLKVKSLYCQGCETEIQGLYELPQLDRLSNDDQTFIIQFVKTSGSLKEMAHLRSLSYPTVRNRLDDIIERIKLTETGKVKAKV